MLRYYEQLRTEQQGQTAKYIAGASDEDLDALEGLIAERRGELAQKSEL